MFFIHFLFHMELFMCDFSKNCLMYFVCYKYLLFLHINCIVFLLCLPFSLFIVCFGHLDVLKASSVALFVWKALLSSDVCENTFSWLRFLLVTLSIHLELILILRCDSHSVFKPLTNPSSTIGWVVYIFCAVICNDTSLCLISNVLTRPDYFKFGF